MTPIANMNRGRVIEKMFPHWLKLTYERSYIKEPESLLDEEEVITETIVLGDVPCSVQNAAHSDGEFINTQYIILCPCLDFSQIGGSALPSVNHQQYRLEVWMNGKRKHAEGKEIVDVDNRDVYEIDGVKIGCTIRVKLKADTWIFGEP